MHQAFMPLSKMLIDKIGKKNDEKEISSTKKLSFIAIVIEFWMIITMKMTSLYSKVTSGDEHD